MSDRLEKTKELADKHLTLQLEMLKETLSLSCIDLLKFQTWYMFNPLQTEVTTMIKKLQNLKPEDLPVY